MHDHEANAGKPSKGLVLLVEARAGGKRMRVNKRPFLGKRGSGERCTWNSQTCRGSDSYLEELYVSMRSVHESPDLHKVWDL